MGSRNSDDPMDLGPFLQNYVMKNPFDQIGLAADKDNPGPVKQAEKSTPPKEKYVAILPKPAQPPPPPVAAASVAAAVEKSASPEPVEKRVKTEEKREENKENGRDRGASVGRSRGVFVDRSRGMSVEETTEVSADTVRGVSVEREDACDEAEQLSPGRPGYVGGHVGSNIAYAMNLRHNRVSEVHIEPQHWLWRNFRYVPKYKGLFSVNDLLAEIQAIFPHITSIVLSRIMKFTFPHCPKITNKAGLFYPGLVGKPRDEYYRDAHLLAAASTVQNGMHTYESAAKAFDVPEDAIASLVLWGEEEDAEGIGITELLEEERRLQNKSPNKRRSPGSKGSKKSDDEEWTPPVKAESQKSDPSPRHSHSLRQRAGKLRFIDTTDSQEDSDMDISSNMRSSNQPPVTPATTRARKRKSTPLKASVCVSPKTTINSNCRSGSKVACQNDGELVEPPTKRSATDGERCNVINPGVHIKEEPKDSGYGDAESPPHSNIPAAHSPVLNVPSCSRSRGNDGAAEGRVKPTDPSVTSVDQRTLKKLIEKIKNQEMRNRSLRQELGESMRENQSLQDQLHSRDEQLGDLASAFFSLNNQFQMIAHRFKMALSSNALDRNLDVLDDNENEGPS